MGKDWYPFCEDARWRMIGLRQGVILGLYLSLRSGFAPWDQLLIDGDWRSVMIWNVAFPTIVHVYMFIFVFVFTTGFWALKYMRRYPGLNHAINMTVMPMAVVTAFYWIYKVRHPFVLLAQPG